MDTRFWAKGSLLIAMAAFFSWLPISELTSALLGAYLWFYNLLTSQVPGFQRNSKYHDSQVPKAVYRPGYQIPRHQKAGCQGQLITHPHNGDKPLLNVPFLPHNFQGNTLLLPENQQPDYRPVCGLPNCMACNLPPLLKTIRRESLTLPCVELNTPQISHAVVYGINNSITQSASLPPLNPKPSNFLLPSKVMYINVFLACMYSHHMCA